MSKRLPNIVVSDELHEQLMSYVQERRRRDRRVTIASVIREATVEYLRREGIEVEDVDVHPAWGGPRQADE